VPADVVMIGTGARAADGKLDLWPAFFAILAALVAGSLIQYWIARGPARGAVYQYGRFVGLTPARLDGATAVVRRGGPITIALSILTPGVRVASVAACGLAGLPMRVFLPGVLLGSTAFLALHLAIGYFGLALLTPLLGAVPAPILAAVVVVVGIGLWAFIRARRHHTSTSEVATEAVGAWLEAACPVCLALGAADNLGARIGVTHASGHVVVSNS
jgi:membrane protein DedA with SNARE-associated domain